ncbi:MAG: thioesterase domain-containing protein, partial [Verrucomicrobiota bacterium]|nr:thioesterase domain-containing protein [Verrucomicrobiota bacterium]
SEYVQPYLGLQLQLLAIWEDVLSIRGIGIRDDFFDLGGNSLLAMRMLHRAELACGKVILPATLFRNPTIERLGAEMVRDVVDESPALLRVNDSGTRTPFFYLHGDLYGGGFYSLKLSRVLGPEQPFYVLPPQDVRNVSAASSIEDMAAEHLKAIRAVRSKGPYVIGGFCIGGLVAYELAQQIKAGGDEVEMLLIIDAEPENRALAALRKLSETIGALLRWDDQKKTASFGRWTVWHARFLHRFALSGQTQRGLLFRVYNGFMIICGMIRRRFSTNVKEPNESDQTDARPPSTQDASSVFLWARAGYRSRGYGGPMALLLSEDTLRFAHKMSRKWQQLVPGVVFHLLKGRHLECITAHVDTLATAIHRSLQTVHPASRLLAEEEAAPPIAVRAEFQH